MRNWEHKSRQRLVGSQNAFETGCAPELRGLTCGPQSPVWKGTCGHTCCRGLLEAPGELKPTGCLGHLVLTTVARKSKSLIY